LEIVSKLITDTDDQIIGIQTSSRDISGRIKAEEEMKLALQKERELNELKSGFVTMASHQFRTPLTVIYSNIELLNYKISALNPTLKKDITVISNRVMNEIDRMTELMNNILIFGKYESGNLKVEIQEVCLKSFFEKIIETYFNHEFDGREVILETFGKSRKVKSDESLLIHIFNNLISNSLKYSKNKANPIVKVVYYVDHFKVEVVDFGIGIPEEEIKHMFQSFFRASNTSNIKGSGLGLIIAKQFTELLNGTISLSSEEGKGTVVTLIFPYEN
jgi:signal transduction histidine kinase